MLHQQVLACWGACMPAVNVVAARGMQQGSARDASGGLVAFSFKENTDSATLFLLLIVCFT
jgi:hypothetical protein